ncbi:MAG: ACT domain-containing protein [Verrucomicrobia bacterium]|jgi:hypothetical protein|nr:ACT domain-containing protein [Verrucomicrobiota bacterium]
MTQNISLRNVPGRYGVARLDPDAPIPKWFDGPGFAALLRADDEVTVVCAFERIPDGVEVDGPWRCLRSLGPFAFNATGIVQSLVNPLSNADIGIFVLCTFDGEHLLIPECDAARAVAVLTEAGHDCQA